MRCFSKGPEELRDGGDGPSGVGATGTCSERPAWAVGIPITTASLLQRHEGIGFSDIL